MITTSTLKELSLETALALIDEGAAFIDLRDVKSYLDAHIAGSLSLLYEKGPGFQSRARDCIPLEVPLILLMREDADMINAASSLRGKGFSVLGSVSDVLREWPHERGGLTSTELYRGPRPRQGFVLDVRDPGANEGKDTTSIPVEQLWGRAHELTEEPKIVVASGYGVRAALAVGILERAGAKQIVVWDTRS